MSKYYTKAIVAVLLVLIGMFGLYSHIEYSGWVLAIGLIAVLV